VPIRSRYPLARQEHVGDMLDELAAAGRLEWRWRYDDVRSRAVFRIREDGGGWVEHDIRSAEEVVLTHCAAARLLWRPVPPPGGRTQREQTLREIAVDAADQADRPAALARRVPTHLVSRLPRTGR
jgi:hypothetical protein